MSEKKKIDVRTETVKLIKWSSSSEAVSALTLYSLSPNPVYTGVGKEVAIWVQYQ